MPNIPLDTFLLRRVSEADARRPARRARPRDTDPPSAAGGNPVPAAASTGPKP